MIYSILNWGLLGFVLLSILDPPIKWILWFIEENVSVIWQLEIAVLTKNANVQI